MVYFMLEYVDAFDQKCSRIVNDLMVVHDDKQEKNIKATYVECSFETDHLERIGRKVEQKKYRKF